MTPKWASEAYVLHTSRSSYDKHTKLDMSMARQRLKLPWLLSGTIRPPHHGHTSQYEWMTHILLVPCQSAIPVIR